MTLKFLRHPFAVEAHFNHSLVLAYAVPKSDLASRLPPYLEVDSYDGTTGFLAAAFVDTRGLRPRGFPRCLGRDFVLAGYRIFVRYRDLRGRRLRGLYILRSETNSIGMQVLGSVFTEYKYHFVPLIFRTSPHTIEVYAPQRLEVIASISEPPEAVPLPEGSPFSSWKEARRFSGPLPFTFSYDPLRQEMLIVEGVRNQWHPRPVAVSKARVDALAELGFPQAQLANAFVVSDIPYMWRAGYVETPSVSKGREVIHATN